MPPGFPEHRAIDPEKALAAYARIAPDAKALPRDQLVTGNLNIVAAAIAAVGVADRCFEPTLLARFQALPASEFDIRHVERLGDLAWGTWHAGNFTEQLKAQKSAAKLPADLVENAMQLKRRMQRCCEYYLSDHPVASRELQRLRPGVDYIDLAGDLAGYGTMYGDYQGILSGDSKYFRPGDRDLALRTSAQIVTLLGEGMTSDAVSARDMALRCFTLLNASYDEVSEAGRWLLRKDANRDVYFPSLYAIVRKPASQGGGSSEGRPDPAGGAPE